MLEYLAHREQARLWRHYRYQLALYCDHPQPSYYYLTEGVRSHNGQDVIWYADSKDGRYRALIDYHGSLLLPGCSFWRGSVEGRAIRCNFDDENNLHVLTEHYNLCKLTRGDYTGPIHYPCYGNVVGVMDYFRRRLIGPLPKHYYKATDKMLLFLTSELRPEHFVLYPEQLLQRLSASF